MNWQLAYFDSWPLYPFRSGPRRPPPGRTMSEEEVLRQDPGPLPLQITGEHKPGCSATLYRDGVTVEWYFPTESDLAVVRKAIPGADVLPERSDLDAPPWHQVQVLLVQSGHTCDWPNLTAPAAIAMLSEAVGGGADVKDENEGKAIARMLAVMDHDHARIMAIADKPDLTANEKMRAICRIDARFYGKSSPEIGSIIGISEASVRQLEWWKVDRAEYRREQKAERRR